VPVKTIKVWGIEELPENEVLEELRVCHEESGSLRQEVIFFAKRVGRKIIFVDKHGKDIEKRDFGDIKWLSYIVRS